ncbi:MAG: CusA/CzcA family heavy metal efflux RND transporter [Bacteroidales bacterium]
MINKIISFSINNKLFIGLMTIALIIGGIFAMKNIPLDATPDITNNQVQVITVAPNLGTEDIEQFVTYQVELAMSNLPDVNEIRSVSRFGLSVVTIVFTDNAGTYLPRQLVSEALIEVKEDIPQGFGEPFMAPISTGLGEIYQYILEVDKEFKDKYDNTELRTIQDWIIKRQMAMTPGVVEVNSFGGNTKQYEIAIDPNRLQSMGISMTEVFNAVQQNNQNTGGAYIEKNYQVNYIRGEGLARSLDDIRNMVIKTENNIPIYIKDIAEVGFGNAIRYGAFTRNGEGEAVGGIIMMLKGANSNKVISVVKKRMEQIQKSLPEGITIKPFLDRSEMIKKTTSTVAENLAIGALIVIFVLVLILGNMRGGFIVASTIPLSLLFAFIMMYIFDVWANLMSLGAIDFGILVDGAVIIVECMVFYLYDKKLIGTKLNQNQKDKLAFKASSKMMNAAFFGQIIIMIVFIPIIVLGGIEGKMFRPMALTFGFALLGVIVLCLTYVPMISSLLLKAPKTDKKSWGDKIVKSLENIYQPIVRWSLNKVKWVIGIAIFILITTVFIFSRMGGEFVPQLDEGNLAMHILMKPGTSLTEVSKTSTKIEKLLKSKFPDEIKSIQTRIGVADIPTDPMPMDIGDCFIILTPKAKWTKAKSKNELLQKFKTTVSAVPGVNYEFSQPVEMRFNELLTGIREDLAIKLYGENLEVLAQKASEIEKLIANIDGVGDIKSEATQGLPQITIQYNRKKLGQYGLNVSDLNQLVSTSFSGNKAGVIYEGQKSFDVVIRLNNEKRTDINDIKNLFVYMPNGKQIPLKEVAEISYKPGPMQISRENTNRRTYVGVNVRGRDVKSLVQEIQEILDAKLNLPAGYYIRYGGSFENLENATKSLKIVVPIALLIIFLLVFAAIKSFRQTLMIYVAIPLAAVGGIITLYLRDMPFSISAGVGFIVLFGVAVMNGLVLISGFNELKAQGNLSLKDIIIKGSLRRIRPIILTASTDILGFLPMAVSSSAGAEVQRPLATVVIGGMLTATLLTLIVLPALYYIVEKRNRKNDSSAYLKTAIAGLILFFTVSIPSTSNAQYQHIDLKEAIDLAKKNYPKIKAVELNIKKQEQLKSTAFDFGRTSVSTSNEGENDLNKSSSLTNISLGQSDIDVFGIYSKNKLIKANIENAKIELNIAKDELEMQVSNMYYSLAYQQIKLELYKQIDSIYSDFVKAAKLKYETEQSSKLEYLSASSRYNELQLEIKRTKADYKAAKFALNKFLLLGNDFIINTNATTPLNQNTNWQNNNSLSLMHSNVVQAKGELSVERSAFLPKIDFAYKNKSIAGINGNNIYEVGISIPLLNGQSGKIKSAKTQIMIEQENMNTFQRNIRSLVQQKITQYQSLSESQQYYKNEAIPLSNEQIKASMLAYHLGEIDYFQLILNIENSFKIKQEYINSNLLFKKLIAEINYLTGGNE